MRTPVRLLPNQLFTTSMDKVAPQSLSGAETSQSARRDSLSGFLVLLSVTFSATLAALAWLSRDLGEPMVLALLGALAAVGIFLLFASAAGLLTLRTGMDTSFNYGTIAASSCDGVIVADRDGIVQFANTRAETLLGVGKITSIAQLEAFLSTYSAAGEAVFRLTRAASLQQAWDEDIGGPVAGAAAVSAAEHAPQLRISVRPSATGDTPSSGCLEWRVSVRDERQFDSAAPAVAPQDTLAAFDSMPIGLMTVRDDQICFANQTLRKWLGQPKSKSAQELTLSGILPNKAAAAVTSALRSPVKTNVPAIKTQLRLSNGQLRPVRLHVGGGDRQNMAGTVLVLDAKNEKRKASAITQVPPLDTWFSNFFQSAPIAIATVDEKGGLKRGNAAFQAMFASGEPADGDASLNVIDQLDRDSRDAARKTLSAATQRQTNLAPVEFAIHDDDKKTGRLYISPLNHEQGQGEVAIVYAVSTTRQRELEDQFAQSQKMQAIGQLAGGMAHDFNNVLTAIILSSDFLLDRHTPTDPAFKDIMAIKQDASRAAGIVRQLLAFSRQQTLRPEILSLTDVVSDWSITLRRLVGETVTLKTKHGRDLWDVKADRGQLEQVIMNLAVNARDAMPDGGKLLLSTYNLTESESAKLGDLGVVQGEYVCCEVTDTGSGMTEQVQEKIFEPFFTTKDVGKGTGLGLSTVYGIIKQTGGYIFCDSEIGKGTSFRIFLPRFTPLHGAGEVAEVAPAPAPKIDRPHDLTGSGTVLLVEDEESVRRFSARALKRQGYNVLQASTGIEALEVMAKADKPVDLVVSDVVMPELDGPGLLRRLRKGNPGIKIIFISGYAEDALKNLDENEEFAFLPKPFQLKDLVEIVKETLSS